MIPFMEFMTLGKGKTVERVKRSVAVSGSWRKQRGIKQVRHRGLGGSGTLSVIL